MKTNEEIIAEINSDKEVNLSPRKKASGVTRFFWWCSGAVIEILEELPTEKNKYFGMGAAIFGTWVLASISGVFAFYTILDGSLFSWPLGFAYGLVIFNLDRFVTSSMKKYGSETDFLFGHEKVFNFIRSEFMPAIPRMLIAIIIGLAISKPLELRIFRAEISRQLEIEKENKRNNKVLSFVSRYETIKELKLEINQIKEEIRSDRSEVDRLQAEYLGEMDGTSGTGRIGISNVALAKRSEYQKVEERFKIKEETNQLNIAWVDSRIRGMESKIEEELKEFEKEIGKTGFLDEIQALNTLINQEGKEAMWWTNIIIIALVILIETSPILVKLISSRGPYDAKLNYINRSKMIKYDLALKKIQYSGD